MPAKRLPNRREQLILPLCVLLAAGATIGWAALGQRYGRQWHRYILGHRPSGIIIHHSATGGYSHGRMLTAADIDAYHAKKGWEIQYKGQTYHIGYHYLILPDGTVEPGRPEEVRGAHCTGHNDQIGICLVGNFSSRANPDGKQKPDRPTAAQMRSLRELVGRLMSDYGFTTEQIHGHGHYGQTDCPGDRLDMDALRESLSP